MAIQSRILHGDAFAASNHRPANGGGGAHRAPAGVVARPHQTSAATKVKHSCIYDVRPLKQGPDLQVVLHRVWSTLPGSSNRAEDNAAMTIFAQPVPRDR